MKSKNLLFVLLIVALGMLAVWGLRHNRLPPLTPKTAAPAAESLPNVTAAEPLAKSTPQNEPSHEHERTAAAQQSASESNDVLREFEKTPASLSLQERLEELTRRGFSLNVLTQQALAQASNMVQEMRQTVNRPIEFYGKVVDENGLPVQGATVEFSCVVYPEDEFRTNTLTGANGMFALNNVTGAVMFVHANKDGYEEMKGTNQNRFEYYSIPGFEGFRSDPYNPVVFHLQKKEN